MVFVSLVRDKYTFLFVSDKLEEIGVGICAFFAYFSFHPIYGEYIFFGFRILFGLELGKKPRSGLSNF